MYSGNILIEDCGNLCTNCNKTWNSFKNEWKLKVPLFLCSCGRLGVPFTSLTSHLCLRICAPNELWMSTFFSLDSSGTDAIDVQSKFLCNACSEALVGTIRVMLTTHVNTFLSLAIIMFVAYPLSSARVSRIPFSRSTRLNASIVALRHCGISCLAYDLYSLITTCPGKLINNKRTRIYE